MVEQNNILQGSTYPDDNGFQVISQDDNKNYSNSDSQDTDSQVSDDQFLEHISLNQGHPIELFQQMQQQLYCINHGNGLQEVFNIEQDPIFNLTSCLSEDEMYKNETACYLCTPQQQTNDSSLSPKGQSRFVRNKTMQKDNSFFGSGASSQTSTQSSLKHCEFCGHKMCPQCCYKLRSFPKSKQAKYQQNGSNLPGNSQGTTNLNQFKGQQGQICRRCDRKFIMKSDILSSIDQEFQSLTVNLQNAILDQKDQNQLQYDLKNEIYDVHSQVSLQKMNENTSLQASKNELAKIKAEQDEAESLQRKYRSQIEEMRARVEELENQVETENDLLIGMESQLLKMQSEQIRTASDISQFTFKMGKQSNNSSHHLIDMQISNDFTRESDKQLSEGRLSTFYDKNQTSRVSEPPLQEELERSYKDLKNIAKRDTGEVVIQSSPTKNNKNKRSKGKSEKSIVSESMASKNFEDADGCCDVKCQLF